MTPLTLDSMITDRFPVGVDAGYHDEGRPEYARESVGLPPDSWHMVPGMQTMPTFTISPSEPGPVPVPMQPQRRLNPRVLDEPRKLLRQALLQLQKRRMPPSVFDSLNMESTRLADKSFATVVDSVKEAVNSKGGRPEIKNQVASAGGPEEDEDDGGKEDVFSTNETFKLMVQLKDILEHSITHGWQIFDNSEPSVTRRTDRGNSAGRLPSPFLPHSIQPGGRRSPSPRNLRTSDLLSESISVLASVVSEDCRYKISSPRPSRPPNALQAVTLDVARYLLHTQRRDPENLSRIGFSLIPAFATFPREMQTRLLTFFEQNVIQSLLGDLVHQRNMDGLLSSAPTKDMQQLNTGSSVVPPVVSINIEELQEHSSGQAEHHSFRRSWSPSSSSPPLVVLSTNAPFQPRSIYHLASLTTPLLAAMLEDISTVLRPDDRLEVLYRFYRLIRVILNSKVDAYLNCLEVIAYHTPKSRHAAVSLLATFWPKAIGHLVISKPLPTFSYQHSGLGAGSRRIQDHPYAHQFVPWRFGHGTGPRRLDIMPPDECLSCSTLIHGFGLMCPFCMCSVHFDCYGYPEGNLLSPYTAANLNVQKVAIYRFCRVLPTARDSDSVITRTGQHCFRTINSFVLSLCFFCKKPLWGCTEQGLQCTSCLHFVHFSCVSDPNLPLCNHGEFNSSHVVIDWHLLQTSFVNFYHDVILSDEDISKLTNEDISIIYAGLWLQLQLLENGLALGSVIINREGLKSDRHVLDGFELQSLVNRYEARLSSSQLSWSPTMREYAEDNNLTASKHSFLFHWPNLVYISTIIKSPCNTQVPNISPSDLLTVPPFNNSEEQEPESNTHPAEVVSLADMRRTLKCELGVSSDTAARLLLSHLHHLGFFNRLDENPILFDEKARSEPVYCAFPLPLGLDLSMEVETLVAAVDACLLDVDLSVNEVGFLLLVRKLWPDGMSSKYASRRLAWNVLSWIVAEDEKLEAVFRDYRAKQQPLPGIRSNADGIPWPIDQNTRSMPSGSSRSGNDYIASRRSLLRRYGASWLLALHNRDPVFYASKLYEFCTELAHDRTRPKGAPVTLSEESEKQWRATYLDTTLHFITKLSQAGVTFTVRDDLFLRWLNTILDLDMCQEHLPSLHRLFPSEPVGGRRRNTSVDAAAPHTDETTGGVIAFDPWHVVIDLASENRQALTRSLHWLCAISRAAVEVPVSTFDKFSSMLTKFSPSLDDSLLLVEATVTSTWLRSVGSQELQAVLSALHARLESQLLHFLQIKDNLPSVVRFIRQTLAVCLLLYGCERTVILSSQMITDEDIENLPSRRKLSTRGSMMSDPVIIDARLMYALERYIDTDVEEVTCLIAKFLNLFVSESPFLEPYEVDNFILRNGRALCSCAWHFYGIQRQDILSMRAIFLLHVLAVDSEPFHLILRHCFQASGNKEMGLLAVTRLFRIVLDVTSPAFNIEGRQWRSGITDIFRYFFSSIWGDEREEIRLAADTCAQTLLPAHFEAISLCWNELLAKSPIPGRINLISFLIQLRPHFPSWRVLSWEIILGVLSEDVPEHVPKNDPAISRQATNNPSPVLKGAKLLTVDHNMALLRSSLVLLSLQMIADGIFIDTPTLLMIKYHLVKAIGFSDASTTPSLVGQGFYVQFTELESIADDSIPCINELVAVLDAHHALHLSPTSTGGPYTVEENSEPPLVGVIFVDVLFIMFCSIGDILALPESTVKNMLESIMIVIHKHDLVKNRSLHHLHFYLRQAARRILDLLLVEVSDDIRLLSLSITQACTRKWPALLGNLICDAVECVARSIISPNPIPDVILSQARSYIETTITMFNGTLFINLCKRPLNSDLFKVLKHIMDVNAKLAPPPSECLRDALLRDSLGRAVEIGKDSFQVVLNNLQQYIAIVHHEGYSKDLMQTVGHGLINLVRRASEWDAVDPTPFYSIAALLIQHNKAQCRDFLTHTETIVRATLARFDVKKTSILCILEVTSSIHRKSRMQSDLPAGSHQPNSIATAILETLLETLKLKTRMLSSTLTAILEAVRTLDDSGSTTHLHSTQEIVEYAAVFLQQHIWSNTQMEDDFTACAAVAKLLFDAFGRDHTLSSKLLSDQIEKGPRQSFSIRSWNVLAWTALSHPSDEWVIILFAHLRTFSSVHANTLKVYTQYGGNPPVSAIADVNHALIAIKLWVMLARKKSLHDGNSIPMVGALGTSAEVIVWNELWPVFESLINVLEAEGHAEKQSPLAAFAWSSAAELFLFLHQLRSPLALETSTQISLLIRLRDLCGGETLTNKLSRTIRAISEETNEVSLDVLVNDIPKEIIAAEKIHILGRKEDIRTVY